MAGALRFVLGDQLSHGLSSLADIDPDADTVLMVEVRDEATYVPHHPKKIALIFSAMRHFAAELQARGIKVDYVRLDDPGNTQSFRGELLRAIERHRPDQIVVTEPGEYRVAAEIALWPSVTGRPIEIRDDDRFICSRADFARWAEGRRGLRMEFFYREMRRRTGLLMTVDGEPEGGRWNLDAENRAALPSDVEPPAAFHEPTDALTGAVIELVRRQFDQHFGDLDGFGFAVTAEGAGRALDHFITHALARFGDYQDAMRIGAPTLFHAVLSPYLNLGLLDPLEVCRRVEAAYRKGQAPLNAAEGFIRQILGWREYVRGIYWLKMPDYADLNALGADRPLPAFYWSGETDLRCLAEAIGETRRNAYAHHIQRLMITGNFALLIGAAPAEVNEWYLSVYADACEWVELPNTHGMAIFADGGILGSKPYAASGKYIDRMSNYCGACAFDVKKSSGAGACPFNFLYWDFLMRHQAKLAGNPRLAMPYRTLARMDPERVRRMRADAAQFLETLASA